MIKKCRGHFKSSRWAEPYGLRIFSDDILFNLRPLCNVVLNNFLMAYPLTDFNFVVLRRILAKGAIMIHDIMRKLTKSAELSSDVTASPAGPDWISLVKFETVKLDSAIR